MNRPAERLATYEDLFDLPDHVIGEILHGQLIAQPRHIRSVSIIGRKLAMARNPRRAGWRHPCRTGIVGDNGRARIIVIDGVFHHSGLQTASLDGWRRNAGTTFTGR